MKVDTAKERRLMTDLQTLKDSYRKMEIDDITYIKNECSLADTLTKIKLIHVLVYVLETGSLYYISYTYTNVNYIFHVFVV